MLVFSISIFGCTSTMPKVSLKCLLSQTFVEGIVPHPWFDDVPVNAAWCVDQFGHKQGLSKGWDRSSKTLLFETHYEDGKLNGSFTMYYTNGVIAELGQLSDDERVGIWETYDDEGQKIQTKIY